MFRNKAFPSDQAVIDYAGSHHGRSGSNLVVPSLPSRGSIFVGNRESSVGSDVSKRQHYCSPVIDYTIV